MFGHVLKIPPRADDHVCESPFTQFHLVELESSGKLFDGCLDQIIDSWVVSPPPMKIIQEDRNVITEVANDAFWVDGKEWFSRGRDDISRMKIAVEIKRPVRLPRKPLIYLESLYRTLL